VDQRWRKTSDNSDRERVKYGYFRSGNRWWRQDVLAGQDEYYAYDGLHQLTNMDRTIAGVPFFEEDFWYDPTGNWHGTTTGYEIKVNGTTTLNQNRTHNVVNEITDITETTGTAWPTPAQNAVGNLTQTPQPLSLGSGYDLKYDAWNRLVEVKVTGGSVVQSHWYDGGHRRLTKTVGANTRHYYYYSDQWQILEERLNAVTTADRRFAWGQRYVDDLVLRDKGTERFYVLHDYFHPTALIDTAGVVQERYGYDCFGTPRYMDASFGSRASSSYGWETLFGAYRYDLESGLYQVRNRYLHCKLGRWLSRDPLENAEQSEGPNLYAYYSLSRKSVKMVATFLLVSRGMAGNVLREREKV
jgi:RHS repeat-associated protein